MSEASRIPGANTGYLVLVWGPPALLSPGQNPGLSEDLALQLGWFRGSSETGRRPWGGGSRQHGPVQDLEPKVA